MRVKYQLLLIQQIYVYFIAITDCLRQFERTCRTNMLRLADEGQEVRRNRPRAYILQDDAIRLMYARLDNGRYTIREFLSCAAHRVENVFNLAINIIPAAEDENPDDPVPFPFAEAVPFEPYEGEPYEGEVQGRGRGVGRGRGRRVVARRVRGVGARGRRRGRAGLAMLQEAAALQQQGQAGMAGRREEPPIPLPPLGAGRGRRWGRGQAPRGGKTFPNTNEKILPT
jgi:hypothetical protein